MTPNPPTEARGSVEGDQLLRAAQLLDWCAEAIQERCKSADLEAFPYVPELTERAEQLRDLERQLEAAHGVTGKLCVMGDIQTGPDEKWPMALLITFDSVDDLRRAINDGHCRYTWGDASCPSGAKGEG